MHHVFIFFLFLVLALTSCTQQEDFEVPEIAVIAPSISGNKTTITAIKNEFDNYTAAIITYKDQDTYLEAYVVSSDQAGNFFKELVVQDAASTPTAGIQVLIDQSALFEQYEFGRKIYIKLDGLSLGLDHGVLKLGKLQENSITAISRFELQNYIIRSPEIATITPKVVAIENFDAAIVSQYIRLENVQFARELVDQIPKTYAGESSDEYDGEREVFQCHTRASTLLSTSTYADFKLLTLPTQQGSITGILTKDYTGDYFILKLNSHTDVVFDGDGRCDPEFLACEGTTVTDDTVLFEENFNTITKDSYLDALGWINVNTNTDEERWENKKITNVDNRVMNISAYNSNLTPLEAWLITPPIPLDNSTAERLHFTVQTSYNNGRALTVWATNAFTGDPTTTTWIPLDVALPFKSSNKVTIKNVPVSCLEGDLHIGFKYKGSAAGITSTYTIDDVKITGKVIR